MQSDWLDIIRWDQNGLIPVIAQDWRTRDILMQAFVNREALALSVQEKRAIYWSRSKKRLWRKGEESGHIQVLHDVFMDCDADSLIFSVEQKGGIACHTGRASCYFHRLGSDGKWLIEGEILKDPAKIYAGSPKD